MPSAVRLRTDFTARELRRLAKKAKDVNQSRRLLSLAAVLNGMSRTEAAMIGGMDRQTLRDWVRRHIRHAASPRRDIAPRRQRRTRCSAARSRRMAYNRNAPHA